MRRAVILLALLALAGCGAMQVQGAAESLVGRPLLYAESRFGIPRLDVRDGVQVAVWDYQEPSSSAAIPLADVGMALAGVVSVVPLAMLAGTSVSIGTAHSCHVIATVQDGRIAEVHMNGDSGGFSGRYAACVPIYGDLIE